MSDYMFVLESHLDAGQNRVVTEVRRIATEAGMNVWLTGGAMRDVMRGVRVTDLDFTVERDAPKTGKALAAALGGVVSAEDALKRWVELELPGGIRASVANSRSEKYSKAGGKPQIAAAGIHEDLSRRDFTINAMGLALNRGSRGLLVDPTNGQADLALPDCAPRPLGLRQSRRAQPAEHHCRGKTGQGVGTNHQAGLRIRTRSGHREAGLANRGTSGAEI